jgi:hypothetical protein
MPAEAVAAVSALRGRAGWRLTGFRLGGGVDDLAVLVDVEIVVL